MKRGILKQLFRMTTLFIVSISTFYISGILMSKQEGMYPYAESKFAPKVDVVIVLSGMVNPLTGKRTPEFTDASDRIIAAEELYRLGKTKYILLSGGSGLILGKGKSEAEILKTFLVGRGIPQSAILVDANSKNTAENAIESAKILNEVKAKKVILVTSAFHMHRSMLCFQKQNIFPIPFPVDYYALAVDPGPEGWFPSPHALMVSVMAFRELIGIQAYRIKGYI